MIRANAQPTTPFPSPLRSSWPHPLSWPAGTAPHWARQEIDELPRSLSLAEELVIDAGQRLRLSFSGSGLRAAPDLEPLPRSPERFHGPGHDDERGRGEHLSGDAIHPGIRQHDPGADQPGVPGPHRPPSGRLDPSVELGIGNSIWYRQGVPSKDGFPGTDPGLLRCRGRRAGLQRPGPRGSSMAGSASRPTGRSPRSSRAPSIRSP